MDFHHILYSELFILIQVFSARSALKLNNYLDSHMLTSLEDTLHFGMVVLQNLLMK